MGIKYTCWKYMIKESWLLETKNNNYLMNKGNMNSLTELHDNIQKLIFDSGIEPYPNSKAYEELITFQRQKSLTTTYSQADILISVALDHLMAISKTTVDPIQTVAPWSCLRAILESSSLAAWLIDPDISAIERAKRSFSLRYDEMIEQSKLAHCIGDLASENRINTRIDDIEQDALKLGLLPIIDRNGKRIGIAQRMISMTELVKEIMGEEFLYRILSALAHGHNWALIQLSYKKTGKESFLLGEDPNSNNHVHILEKHIDNETIYGLVKKVISKPVINKSILFGWDIERAKSLFNWGKD